MQRRRFYTLYRFSRDNSKDGAEERLLERVLLAYISASKDEDCQVKHLHDAYLLRYTTILLLLGLIFARDQLFEIRNRERADLKQVIAYLTDTVVWERGKINLFVIAP